MSWREAVRGRETLRHAETEGERWVSGVYRRGNIVEAAGVAVLMQGGPAFTHLRRELVAALEHLQGKSGT